MRKLLLSFTLLTFAFGGVAFAVDLPSDVGMIKRATGSSQSTPTRVYKLVRFGSNTTEGSVQTISAGEAVVYDTISDDGVTIRRTTTSADVAFAGIAVTSIPTSDALTGTTAADDSGRRNWGYIIVHGPTTAAIALAGTNGHAAGDPFITSTDSGRVTTFAASSAFPSNGERLVKQTGAIGGFFFDASDTTSTSIEVFVKAE